MRLQTIDLRSSMALYEALNEALATDIRSLAALAVNENARDTIFLIHLSDDTHNADMQTFVRAGRLKPTSEAAVIVAASDKSLNGLTDEHWDTLDTTELIGPLDGLAFAAARVTEADSLSSRVKATVAVEVGVWDLCLTERLLDLPMKEALRPDLCSSRWIDGDHEELAQRQDSWGGEIARHAVWLVRNDPESLRKRVWRGQLGVLFPWIEERRREVIIRHRAQLRATEKTTPEVEMLDWGPIAVQLGNSARGCPKAILAARAIRNELAHGRPVTWPMIWQCLQEFRVWASSKV